MKEIKVEDAVGQVLCHDMTQIIKGVTKDAAFRKGHIITEQDIPILLSMGKEHIYVWEKEEGMLHENDAAQLLYNICAGKHMIPSEIKEGKIEVIADCDGLLIIDSDRLKQINLLGEIMIATQHSYIPVKKGAKLAGTRVIPLVIEAQKINEAQKIGGTNPLLELHPFHSMKVGIVTTGSEVFYGRIQDTFTPVLEAKLKELNCEVYEHVKLPDDSDQITSEILKMAENGVDMVLCTGGMSVDPDDKTPLAIKNTGAKIISYGAPVLPGAMCLLAYLKGNIPIVGLPGCVMYAKRTIFDLILPRLVAGIEVTEEQLASLGLGGLCLNCEVCTYPNCGFGKGV